MYPEESVHFYSYFYKYVWILDSDSGHLLFPAFLWHPFPASLPYFFLSFLLLLFLASLLPFSASAPVSAHLIIYEYLVHSLSFLDLNEKIHPLSLMISRPARLMFHLLQTLRGYALLKIRFLDAGYFSVPE